MKKRSVRRKARVAIIGTGNIGSDLLIKIMRSKTLTCSMFIGQNPASLGIARAAKMGIPIFTNSIDAIVDNPDACDIVFDATTALSHRNHAPILKKMGKFTIDMTPSRIGKMCVPLLNLESCLHEDNINMISCGGQATTPIIAKLMQIYPEIRYVEVVSSIASKSAGIGTRDNIDEYTQTTCDAIIELAGVPYAKAIIILNPADPPILMHNTIYAQVNKPDINLITRELKKVVSAIRTYVPGFQLTLGPVYENNRLTIMTEVVGSGDYLPLYAGNLDIVNCAAVTIAQRYVQQIV